MIGLAMLGYIREEHIQLFIYFWDYKMSSLITKNSLILAEKV
jgi:hypothetical protein